MNINIRIFLFLIQILIILPGCTPDRFYLKQTTLYPISCFITGKIDNVEKLADNAIKIKDGGRVSLRRYGMTQFTGDFTVELIKGEGIRFYLRSADNNFSNHPTICFEYLNKKCIFRENNKVLFETDTLFAEYNRQSRIKILDDGKKLKLSIDCADINFENISIPSTEYIIIESAGGGEAIISGLDMIYLYEEKL
jgi:hypothetical protein